MALELHTRLKQGPALLLLGQDYLRLESGADPFLSECLSKYCDVSGLEPSYNLLLDSRAVEDGDAALAWLHHRCRRLAPPLWMNTVAQFAWNSIYTSAIDDIWTDAFRSDWRELHSIFSDRFHPEDPRNRTRLHATFLFGSISRSEKDERPPLRRRELLARRLQAIALARRVPDIVTPFGTFVIEGYAGSRDWMSLDELIPIIDALGTGQTHIFSAGPELGSHPDVIELVQAGKVALYSQSLADYLFSAEGAGYLSLQPPEDVGVGTRAVRVGDRLIAIPPDLWARITLSAQVLDCAALMPPQALSKDATYREFRNFLSDASVKPLWEAYARGFAFTRSYATHLRKTVDQQLKSTTLEKPPILLHGQTGIGKTVALRALAYEVARQGKHPVLFMERRLQRPVQADIDAFCKWVEDLSGANTLIVWDGMLEVEPYHDLVRHLAGRGRKVVLVGSNYQTDESKLRGTMPIPASPFMDKPELERFEAFLTGLDPSLAFLAQRLDTERDPSFLVALYRLLPPSRAQLRSGVVREVGTTEQEIRSRITQLGVGQPITALATAMLEAGLITSSELLSEEPRPVGDEQLTELEELIGLIMVPGRFGLSVPIELLLRALRNEVLNIVDVLRELDIFRWSEDAAGNIAVSPRSSLEARLLVDSRLGGARTEVAFANKLILALRDYEAVTNNPHIQFVVDMVRAMGPNGPSPTYFRSYYEQLASALQTLRQEHAVRTPRLMLQEATLLREAVKGHDDLSAESAETMLDKMSEVLRQALELAVERNNRKLQSQILVELGAAIGTKLNRVLADASKTSEAFRMFEEARTYLFRSKTLDPDNYYPVDVLAWTARDLVQQGILGPAQLAEVEADVLHAFQRAEEEGLAAHHFEDYQKRRMELGRVFGSIQLSEDAFRELEESGSCAGYYLKARDMVADIDLQQPLSAPAREACARAATYLEKYRPRMTSEGRCLHLLFRLWWMSIHDRPLFYGERQTIGFSIDEWRYCMGLIEELLAIGESYRSLSLQYIHALGKFHLGLIEESLDLFRELERDADQVSGRRRVLRHYVLSLPGGRPQLFTGTVSWADEQKNRGELYVDDLRRTVRFFPLDFGRQGLQAGETIGRFHIAFNYLGPIADPPMLRHSRA